ncbi:type VII secretion protein EsaA [Virgibacillus natechei]
MKKGNKRILLFLVLMLLLASGLSYLGFNQVSKVSNTEEGRETQTMAMDVAVVNEDDGATFNDNEVSFGDAFVSSMDRDESHDWYVVSRGVAESGLERNTYDMMIIVPNDFSEKALSMESDSPEQVSLNYKINTSGNERVQTEAEKTASEILNDVNRRIIDVYFASIVGNLQDAQDSVGSIVERQGDHTYTYNNSVNDPLSSYTDRFSEVKDNTETSKDSFSGLEEILETFNDGLNNQDETNQSYLSAMEDHFELTEGNSNLSEDFFSQLSDFSSQINSEDVLQQLEQLEAANEAINNQFQQDENDRQTIVTNAATIQRQLDDTSEQIANLDTYLRENLDSDMRSRVGNRLSGIFEDALDGEQSNLSILFSAADNQARQSIQKQINQLPPLNMNEIKDLGLSGQTVTELENVIGVTNKYNEEFGYKPRYSSNRETLPQLVQEIKAGLAHKGVEVTDTVKIPEEIQEPGSTFDLKIPKAFKESGLTLTLNGEEIDYEPNGGKIKLPPMNEGDLTVSLNLKLRDSGSNIDVFQPVTWSWEMDLAGIKDVDETEESKNTASLFQPDAPLVATMSTDGSEEDGEQETSKENTEDGSDSSENDEEQSESPKDNGEENGESENDDTTDSDPDQHPEQEEPKDEGGDGEKKDPGSGDDTGDTDDTEEDQSGSGEDPEDEEGNGDGDGKGNEDEDGDEEGEEDDNEEEDENEDDEEPETVNIINHKIKHQVESSLTNDSTKDLINAASDTVSDYQRLLALYESYFGIDMESNGLGGGALKNLASDDSLYTLFNEPNIANVLEGYMVNLVTDRITAEVRQPIESLQNQIQEYDQLVNEVDGNADELADNIVRTMDQAEVMNNNLEETLADLSAWREESMGLIDEQENVQSNRNEEQSAFMTMGNDLQSLFSETESLASQADTNLDSADNVYQTFDAIDEQANDIQESGVALVDQADTLSVDMTETLQEDQNFANNFAGVLANSRVGDRQNEDLYDFLSSPVETKNDGVIGSGGSSDVDSENTANAAFTPYYVVLICFIVALFTAYVISTNNQRRMDGDQFAQDKSLVGKNLPLTGLTASIGVVEGLVIGLTSGYLLQIGGGRLFVWVGLITLVMLAMLLVAAYLLRQLKMIGMFILLAVLSLYLFLTDALAVSMSQIETVRMFSPLQHVETMLGNVINGTANGVLSIIILIGIALIGAGANLFVLHQTAKEETADEGAAEAN